MKTNTPQDEQAPPPLARDRARELRRDSTEAEHRLWSHLRNKGLGVKFRRQHPIGPFIVDFFSLGSETRGGIDGGQHNEDDKRRADDQPHKIPRRSWLSNSPFLEQRGAARYRRGANTHRRSSINVPHPRAAAARDLSRLSGEVVRKVNARTIDKNSSRVEMASCPGRRRRLGDRNARGRGAARNPARRTALYPDDAHSRPRPGTGRRFSARRRIHQFTRRAGRGPRRPWKEGRARAQRDRCDPERARGGTARTAQAQLHDFIELRHLRQDQYRVDPAPGRAACRRTDSPRPPQYSVFPT